MRKVDPVARKIIAALVVERPDWTYREIAEGFRCSGGTVASIAEQFGCRRAFREPRSDEEEEAATRDYEANEVPVDLLAKKYGMGESGFRRMVYRRTGYRRKVVDRETADAITADYEADEETMEALAEKWGVTLGSFAAIAYQRTDFRRGNGQKVEKYPWPAMFLALRVGVVKAAEQFSLSPSTFRRRTDWDQPVCVYEPGSRTGEICWYGHNLRAPYFMYGEVVLDVQGVACRHDGIPEHRVHFMEGE